MIGHWPKHCPAVAPTWQREIRYYVRIRSVSNKPTAKDVQQEHLAVTYAVANGFFKQGLSSTATSLHR